MLILLYGLLNTSSIKEFIRKEIVKELKVKLNTDLNIESLNIQPFNIVQLNGIYLNDEYGDTIFKAQQVYADVEILPLLDRQIIFTAARLKNFNISLSKDSLNAPLNIQFIIDAFKPQKEAKTKKFDVKINTLNISNGNLNYNIKNKPKKEEYLFDENHIQVKNIDSKISLKSLSSDSLNIQIKKLSLKEKNGLEIKNLLARIIFGNKNLQIKGFHLQLPNSSIKLEKCNIDLSNESYPQSFLDNAYIYAKTTDSYVTPIDISSFVPVFKSFKERVYFQTEFNGTVNNINIVNIALDYEDKIQLRANGLLRNLKNKDKIYVKGSVNQLYIKNNGLIGLLNNLSDKQKSVEESEFINLGSILFTGNIAGYINQLNTNGHLTTELGNIDANVVIGFDSNETISAYYKGNISTKGFNLNKLLRKSDLGNIAFDLDINLEQPKNGKLGGLVRGDIHQFVFKNYNYKDIIIDGKYDGLKLEGALKIDDPNGELDISGLFDLSKPNPELNFSAHLKDIRLDNLNLSNKYKESYLSLDIDANFIGKDIDNLQGYIILDSLSFLQSGKTFKLKQFKLTASGYQNNRRLTIVSDIVNGNLQGTYSYSTIVKSIKRSLNRYLPDLIDLKNNRKKILKNDLTFDLTINNTEKLSDILALPITIYSPTKIIGFYNNINERFKVEAFMPSSNIFGSKLESGYLGIENTDQNIKGNISGTFVTKNDTKNNLSVDFRANDNKINIGTSFLNQNQNKLKGTLSNTIQFTKDKNTKTLITDILIDAGQIVLNNSVWNMGESHIKISPKTISVDNYQITNTLKDQQLKINGKYSTKEDLLDNQLRITLQNIDLEYIFTTLAISALDFSGSANGTLLVSSISGKPYADINLLVDDFGFNKTKLGKLHLNSQLDPITNKVNLRGNIKNNEDKTTKITGEINPITQELSIYFDSEELDISFLNKYAESLFNDIKGTGIGNIHLFGNFSKVTVDGQAFIKNGEIGINLLNTRYNFTDTIYLKKDLIYFNDITLYDQKKNTAKLSGKIVHDYFSNFVYYVQLKSNNFLLYNATAKTNPIFYGTVFGSGYGTVKGNETNVDIDMNIQTKKGTHVYMNFMDEAATEYSFITYKQKETNDTTTNKIPNAISKFEANKEMDVNMNFYVDATPDATVELLMDPIGGDKLKGTGNGTMQFIWGTNKNPLLFGTYEIFNGSYNFTFQKILERKFTIQNGSTIQFSGDPFKANLDVTAKYRVVANLFDLDKNLVTTTGQTSVPVNCLLNLTGPLIHPLVKPDIELPSTDPEIARQIKNLISSEDMMNRQIAYLLILSKFYSPSYAETDHKTNDFASFASATLSTQLGNILSSIDDRWQVGTNIRTSDSNFSSTEVELLLSSRLLNDRILFNGNFGYRDNPITQDAFIGDVDIEVLLNKTGNWRLKAYNHYNEKFYYINNNATQTQGVGIIYKRDFDEFKDLFKRSKKEKNITNKEKDSIDTKKIKLDSLNRDSLRIQKNDSSLFVERSFIMMKKR